MASLQSLDPTICLRVIQRAISICLYQNRAISANEVQGSLSKHGISLSLINEILEAYFEVGGVSKHSENGKVSYSCLLELDGEKQLCFPDGAFLYAKSKEQANEYKALIRPKIQERFPSVY